MDVGGESATLLLERLQASAIESGGKAPCSSVTAIDLPRLAALVGCSVADLAGGLAREGPGLHAAGRVAVQSEEVAFEADDEPASTAPLAVETVLLSVASRPSVLDSDQTPKVLMNLAGEPVIAHVLMQLCNAGIRRAVIVLGTRGRQIRSALLEHAVSRRLVLDFIDLGEHFAAGFARSLLEARRRFDDGGPFLLCTAVSAERRDESEAWRERAGAVYIHTYAYTHTYAYIHIHAYIHRDRWLGIDIRSYFIRTCMNTHLG